MAISDLGESYSSEGLKLIPVSPGLNGRGFEKVLDMFGMFKKKRVKRVRENKSNKVLGWPKRSFVFFHKMALVALSCL